MEVSLNSLNITSLKKTSYIKIAVCDDEKVILDRIANIISSEFRQKNVNLTTDKFQDRQSLINSPDIDNYNIMFLDIDLKTDNGTELSIPKPKYNEINSKITIRRNLWN